MNGQLTLTENTNLTISSLDLWNTVNDARHEADEPIIRRNDFMSRVADELEGEHYESFVVTNPNGTESKLFRLTHEQCMLVAMRESKSVRRKVLDKLKELETGVVNSAFQLPDFTNPAIAARAWADQVEARMLAERTKAEIGSRREATAMATASAASRKASKLELELDRSQDYATVKRMSKHYHSEDFNWRELKRVSLELGQATLDVFDVNYGTVKAYHADVWRKVYDVDIPRKESGRVA